MFIKGQTNFHDCINPIVYFNCFVGMGAYRQTNISDTVYLFMKLYTIIVIPINWTMHYFSLSGKTHDSVYYQDASPAARVMYQVLKNTNSCIVVTSPILLWLQNKGLKDCLRQMLSLDDTFQDILRVPNDYRKQYIRLVWHVIGIVFVVSFVGIYDLSWIMVAEGSVWKKLAFTVTLHYPIIVMLVLDWNFCTFVGYMEKKFRDLNEGLLGMAKKPSDSSGSKKVFVISRKVSKARPDLKIKDIKAGSLLNDDHYLLHEIRKMYLKLFKLSRKINLTFGIQNLLSLGISFAMVTGLLYTIYSAFAWDDSANNNLMKLMPSVLWTTVYTFKIWIVNHLCWRLSDEAERTGDVIYDLLESSAVDKEFRTEVQEFAVQILQNPIRLNACGFFTLDHTFVQGVIGSITAYLVILIQMGHRSEIFTLDTVHDQNSTKISPN